MEFSSLETHEQGNDKLEKVSLIASSISALSDKALENAHNIRGKGLLDRYSTITENFIDHDMPNTDLNFTSTCTSSTDDLIVEEASLHVQDKRTVDSLITYNKEVSAIHPMDNEQLFNESLLREDSVVEFSVEDAKANDCGSESSLNSTASQMNYKESINSISSHVFTNSYESIIESPAAPVLNMENNFTDSSALPLIAHPTAFILNKETGSTAANNVCNTSSSAHFFKHSTNVTSGSLKESVFRVFREVAKSVNTEKVNENLNENFKQMRNVLKTVASDKFTGQIFSNKIVNDVYTAISNESLNTLPPNCELFSVTNGSNSNAVLNTQDSAQQKCLAVVDSFNLKNSAVEDSIPENKPFCALPQRSSMTDIRLGENCSDSRSNLVNKLCQSETDVKNLKDCQLKKICVASQIPPCTDNFSKASISSSGDNLSSKSSDVLEALVNDKSSSDFDVEILDFLQENDTGDSVLKSYNVDKLLELHIKIRDICKTLLDEKKLIRSEIEKLKQSSSHKICEVQLRAVEEQLQQVRKELSESTVKHQKLLAEQLDARSSLSEQIEKVTKQCHEAISNRDSMVVKYATAERNVLTAQKLHDGVLKQCRDLEKDKEVLLARVKNITAEKNRIMQVVEKKINECHTVNKELERLKDEIANRDTKIKWSEMKLKADMETLTAAQARLEVAESAIKQHEAEMAAVRDEAHNIVQKALTDETSRANVLGKEVTEHKSRLIVEEATVKQLREELSIARRRIATLQPHCDALEEQATTLKKQVATCVAEREESERLFASLQQEMKQRQQQCSALKQEIEQLLCVRTELLQFKEQLEAASEEIETLHQCRNEQEAELKLAREKEAELLHFTQTLSETNSTVQSKLNAALTAEKEWQMELKALREELVQVRRTAAEEKSGLTSQLSDTTSRLDCVCEQLSQQNSATRRLLDRVAELEGEAAVCSKRHANVVKDLTRELNKLRRRVAEDGKSNNSGTVESCETSCSSVLNRRENSQEENVDNRPASDLPIDKSSHTVNGNVDVLEAVVVSPSHASSRLFGLKQVDVPEVVLKAGDTNVNAKCFVLPESPQGSSSSSSSSIGNNTFIVKSMGPPFEGHDEQMLVQRIVKLQRSLAKKAEKEEFFEEHNAQLVAELQKKNKIIEYFLLKEETGTMSDNKTDIVKARMMQQRGIMSSIYGSQAKDETMTLQLSLEINKKLQSLFEDVLLKNITLKESLSTLGDEVARLSVQANRRNN